MTEIMVLKLLNEKYRQKEKPIWLDRRDFNDYLSLLSEEKIKHYLETGIVKFRDVLVQKVN